MGDSSISASTPAGSIAELQTARQQILKASERIVGLKVSMTNQDLDAAEEALQTILQELDWISVEARTMATQRSEESLAREQIARLSAELERIHQSAGWALLQRARRVRRHLFREGTARGQMWKLGIKTVKWVLHTGVRPDHRPVARVSKSGRQREAATRSPNTAADRDEPQPSPRLKVTALVPNYNHEAYLEERLRSIFNQTRLPDEILFLDDASRDGSLEVARRMASQSPIPFRMVLNEHNSGSTFRQWIKGFDLAIGDLIWIAESDDSCAPEFLETMIPAFDDHKVSLAYCQSTVIGPNGEPYADNYLFNTDDISTSHWSSAYCISGAEEVELTLSQKNTIPNASAVLFRKPVSLDEADELVKLRLSGDWLFYAMRIRTGKIAFVPESLNFHRQHPKTVRNAYEHATRLFDEQLRVKARIFESFSISSNAISRSLGCTIRDYNDRALHFGAAAQPISQNAELAPHWTRIARVTTATLPAPDRLRVLMVVDALDGEARQLAAIRLAKALANREQVFLLNARPSTATPRLAARVDPRVVLLEGSLGITPWSFGGDVDPAGTQFEPLSSRRSRVIEELIRFHNIDVIHSHGWWADRLVLTVNRDLAIPWFVDLRGELPGHRAETDLDRDFPRLIAPILSSAQGVFYAQPEDLSIFARYGIALPACVTQLFDSVHGLARDQVLERSAATQQGEFRLLVACTDAIRPQEERDLIGTIQRLNALSDPEPGHRPIRLIIPTTIYGCRQPPRLLTNRYDQWVRHVDAEIHEIAAHCDAGLIAGVSPTRAATAAAIECLASGLPVIADTRAVSREFLHCEDGTAGILVEADDSVDRTISDLTKAVREYMLNPEHHARDQQSARRVFDQRFHLDIMADRALNAYRTANGRSERPAARANHLRIA